MSRICCLNPLHAADFDVEAGAAGNLVYDEVDKIGKTSNNVSITRDVSGEGVQQSLLKMLEGTVANVPPQGGRKHPEQQYIQMDTSNILFICGGTFVGVEEIVRKRLGKKTLGFGVSSQTHSSSLTAADLMPQVTSDDILEFGMIPEFVGRLPVVAALCPLDEAGLVQVLNDPKNALVKQYRALCQMEGCDLQFSDEALQAISRRALQKSVGARGLRGIVESIMLDLMFDLPEQPKGTRFTVDVDPADGPIKVFTESSTEKKSA